MSVSRLIRRRIKSAKNIAQITKAMEMVSASKMRHAQEQTLAGKPYAEKLTTMLKTIARHTNSAMHPLLQTNDAPKSLIVLISSNRGLAGGLSTNLFKAVEEFMKPKKAEFVVIGKKGKEYALKFRHTIIGEFTALPDRIRFEDTLPIAELVMKAFLDGEYSDVHLVHMQFVSTLSQKVKFEQILPPPAEEIQQPADLVEAKSEYLFEPNSTEILEFLLPYYIAVEIYHTLLDAKASEHSARMVAMKSASDNARDVMNGLQLVFNKSRQAAITTELIDMTTATLSVAG